MGSLCSKTVVTKPREKFGEAEKKTCLVFGMPDSGQTAFIKSVEKSFSSTSGFNQTNVVFLAVSTDRVERVNWVSQYTSNPNVIASFFFVDVTSPSSALLSLKTLNWMISQMGDIEKPLVVGYVKTQNHSINFKTLKDYLDPAMATDQFHETNQADVARFIEYISKCIANHQAENDQN